MSNELISHEKHIANAIKQGEYRYTLHAAQQRIARGIRRSEVEQVLTSGEVIENYPNHHYEHACLVYGITKQGKVIHAVCSLNNIVDIITLYEPSEEKWLADMKTRRKKL